MISANENFISKIEIGNVVEILFPEKINHDLFKFYHFR